VCKAKGHRALVGFCLGDEMKRIRIVLHGLIAYGKLKNETCLKYIGKERKGASSFCLQRVSVNK